MDLDNRQLSETEALKGALRLMGMDPDKLIVFMQKDKTEIEQHVLPLLKVVPDALTAKAFELTDFDYREITRLFEKLQAAKSVLLPQIK